MRYTLHTAGGVKIAEADTAQDIGDLARHRTVSIDHEPTGLYRYTVWRREPGAMVGTQYVDHVNAFQAVARLPREA